MFAHSIPSRSPEEWESLTAHLDAVGRQAACFGAAFGFAEVAEWAGRMHDIGKCSAAFQAYVAASGAASGPDHSTAGAREAMHSLRKELAALIAPIIAGHHAGLPDGDALRARLGPAYHIEPYAGWDAHAGARPDLSRFAPPPTFRLQEAKGFSLAFLTRMLFSCLVDADFLETEAFYDRAEGRAPVRGEHTPLATLRNRLRAHMAGLRTEAAPEVQAVRARVLDHATARAELPPGAFTLTVPTGGGKTLASLSFALEHAVRHGLRRVVYVIPYTSIIEQTAGVFRDALGADGDILEHHVGFDWNAAESPGDEAAEARDAGKKLRKAAENWDVPIVVTTAVQFFESLFANRPAKCRKLHNLARSVVVLDEVQTLPLRVLRPCVAALKEISANYGGTVVLCTATQPALRQKDGFSGGFEIDDDRELAPEPRALYAALKRVRVEAIPQPVGDDAIVARFNEPSSMMCIVNTRRHARALFEAIRDLPGAAHLSTRMCAVHRRQVLAATRARLAAGEIVRIVSTSLIEAGVDIDLPEVWRAAAGLDSIAQAAGRCNRNGLLNEGRVVVFEPASKKPPHDIAAFWQAARPVLRSHADVLALDAIEQYFRTLYWQRGDRRVSGDALDATIIAGQSKAGVLPVLADHAQTGAFPFRSLAVAFRLIEDATVPVVIPWDEAAKRAVAVARAAERVTSDMLRALQPYAVAIRPDERRMWLDLGAVRPVNAALGDELLAFDYLAPYYDLQTGLAFGAAARQP